MVDAWKSANINPETIGYFEAHGTGTKIGDPLEINAIKQAFTSFTQKKQFCALGTIKGTIGHTEATAGLAGVIKVLLQMRYGLIPSLPMFKTMSPLIELDDCPLYINKENQVWSRQESNPRRGVVSSFGIGGTYAHAVIEEGPAHEISEHQSKPFYLLTLSAKHPDSLKQRIEDLYAYVKKHPALPLEPIAYTLNVSRNHFDYRCAMVVSSTDELQKTLERVQQGVIPDNYFIAKDKISKKQEPLFKEILVKLIQDIQFEQISSDKYREKLQAMADLYIRGYEPDWTVLHEGESRQKVTLPTYPFLKDRYWVRKKLLEENALLGSLPIAPVEHYLLATPIQKDGDTYRYQCALSPTTTVLLRDHVVFGYPILPTDSLLELIYTAGLRYFGIAQLDIKQVFILSPVIGLDASPIHLEQLLVPDGEDVRISLSSNADAKRKMVHLESVVSISTEERPTITVHQQIDESWETIDLSTLLKESYPIQLGPFFKVFSQFLSKEKQPWVA